MVPMVQRARVESGFQGPNPNKGLLIWEGPLNTFGAQFLFVSRGAVSPAHLKGLIGTADEIQHASIGGNATQHNSQLLHPENTPRPPSLLLQPCPGIEQGLNQTGQPHTAGLQLNLARGKNLCEL